MTFAPVGSTTLILVIATVVLLLRLLALYRVWAQPRSRGRWQALARWAGLTTAALLLVGAAARPGVDADREVGADASAAAGPNIFLVVDRSAESPVIDMRAQLTGVLDEYPRARVALISFATGATVDWPLSEDVASLRSVIGGLTAYVPTVPDPQLQANAFAARDVLRSKIDTAATQYPGTPNLVFYFGTGDPDSVVSRGAFDLAPGSVAGGAVFEYQPADPARLQEIADQLGVPLGTALPDIGDAASVESVQVADRHEFYWAAALLAALLLLAEIAFTLREYHRNRLRR
jgi:Ca-activated chloride channel homolog